MDERSKGSRGGNGSATFGSDVSRRNALKHGLTAKRLLPDVLKAGAIDEAYERLYQEWRPATPTAEFLVRELARHEAALAKIEQIEEAILRRGAQHAAGALLVDTIDLDAADAALAGAGTSDAISRISRYRKSHERAHARAMHALRDLAASAAHESAPAKRVRCRFTSEADCVSHLLARASAESCPRCDSRTCHWLPSRAMYQCRICKHQRSVRRGTVMEKSRVPLLAWFQGIERLLTQPEISTAELAKAIGIKRPGTVRRLTRSIRGAARSSDATALLAGLDRIFGNPYSSGG